MVDGLDDLLDGPQLLELGLEVAAQPLGGELVNEFFIVLIASEKTREVARLEIPIGLVGDVAVGSAEYSCGELAEGDAVVVL